MLIALRWQHRPSTFCPLWDTGESLQWNLWMAMSQLRRWGLYRGDPGVGCICERYIQPDTVRWPHWFWSHWYWDQHVQVCPVPRDEHGNVIKE